MCLNANTSLALEQCINKLSSVMYSHHCMTRFHSEYKEKAAPKHLKSLRDSENRDMQKLLLKHRIVLWTSIQTNVVEIFKATNNFFFNLSVRELFDILTLTNKFLEVGLDFARPKECLLLDEILSL